MKNFLKPSLLLIVAACAILTGCEKNEETKSISTGDSTFTFAAIGHQWIMGYDNAMPKVYENDTLFIVSRQDSNTWLMNNGSLIYCSQEEFGLEKEGHLFTVCKANAQENDQYSGFDGDCKVVAINLPVTVPAGTFNCFKIERSINGEYRETYYINRRYGLIKDENEEFVSYLLSTNFGI